MSETKDKKEKTFVQLNESVSELKEQRKLLVLAEHIAAKTADKLSPNVIDVNVIRTAIAQVDEQITLKQNPSKRKTNLSKDSE